MSRASEKPAAHGLNPYRYLSEDERIRKIGELLATAALRYLHDKDRESLHDKKPVQARVEVWDLVDDEIEKQVLRYLDVNVMASTGHIEKALHIPHMTLSRRLARLRKAGFIDLTGRTRNAIYCLAINPGNN